MLVTKEMSKAVMLAIQTGSACLYAMDMMKDRDRLLEMRDMSNEKQKRDVINGSFRVIMDVMHKFDLVGDTRLIKLFATLPVEIDAELYEGIRDMINHLGAAAVIEYPDLLEKYSDSTSLTGEEAAKAKASMAREALSRHMPADQFNELKRFMLLEDV